MPVHPRHISFMESGTPMGAEDVQHHIGQHLLLPLIIMIITKGREEICCSFLPALRSVCVGIARIPKGTWILLCLKQ